MPLSHSARRGLPALVLSMLMLLALLSLALCSSALADTAKGASQQDGIVWKTCDPPPMCFRSQEERQQWAKENQCQFLEDLCQDPTGRDDKGAQEEDRGLWGGLWGSVKSGLVYGYEFVKGLTMGLKDQVTGLWDLISNPGEVVSGLIKLGKAFYDDPAGTLKMLAELLGQEVIDTIQRATQCGAYDLGKVIGENVNPVVMLKIATQLSRYSGKLADAVKGTKRELGCASFAGGTPVLTPQGVLAVERITIGQQVLSRDDVLYVDAPQRVDNIFVRTAHRYRLLTTESDSLRLTDEHPLYVQGKGWLRAEDVTDDDVLASARGDVRVLRNEVVAESLRVYNFSVRNTPSYFVGYGGVWAHNAKCDITFRPGNAAQAWEKLLNSTGSPSERAALATMQLRKTAQEQGWKKRGDLSAKNGGREVYQGQDGFLYAFDLQHGRFEKLDKKGRHLGEVDIDLKSIEGSMDKSGGHDLIL